LIRLDDGETHMLHLQVSGKLVKRLGDDAIEFRRR
jgi:hypothetical protein